MFGACFVLFLVFTVLSTFAIISLRQREFVNVALLKHVLAVTWVSVFCDSSSWCHGLVGLRSVLVILTCFKGKFSIQSCVFQIIY